MEDVIQEILANINTQIESLKKQMSEMEKKVEDNSSVKTLVERLDKIETGMRKVKSDQISTKVISALRRNATG